MADAHKALSIIAREFSVTAMVILWRSNMTDHEYDQRYLKASANMDELRAFAGLHEPSLVDDIEKLHGQMNMFWGNFKNVLYQTSLGQRIDHNSPSLTDAHAAAGEIGSAVLLVKRRISRLAAEAKRNAKEAVEIPKTGALENGERSGTRQEAFS
jgi:hypothetical protein